MPEINIYKYLPITGNHTYSNIELGLNGEIIDANTNFLLLFGYTLNEIKDKHHDLLIKNKSPKAFHFKKILKILRKGETLHGEFERKGKNGKTIWVIATYHPIQNQEGNFIRIRKVLKEISSQKKSEETLTDSLKEISDYKFALDKSAIVATTNQKGIILTVNDQFCKISKYNKKELIGQDHRIINSGYHSKDFIRNIWTTIANGKVWKGEIKNKAKDGSYYWVATTIIPFLDKDGKPFQYIAIRFDITKQKEQEESLTVQSQELKQQKLELAQQIEALNQSAIVSTANIDGNITFVNEMFCTISGYTKEELIGQNHRILKSFKQPNGLFKGMWKAISMGKIWKGEIQNKKKNGEYYWVNTTIVPIKNLEGKIYKYIAIRYDITRQKQQQEEKLRKKNEELKAQQEELREANIELEAQTEQLQASEEELRLQQEELNITNNELEEQSRLLQEKNQAINEKNEELVAASFELQKRSEEIEQSSKYKSEFLANMSHELRTPLNSILLLSKLLSENTNKNLSKEQIEFASVIHKSGNNLLELINEILDLSKIEAGKMDLDIQLIDIESICSNMKATFSPIAIEKDLSFSIKMDKNVPLKINSDRIRVEQVLKNFLSNAFKFTKNGSVTFIIRPLSEIEAKEMKIVAEKSICFEVIDTGIGISKEKHKLIFEAFRQADGTTRRKYGGTGLGLSISSKIIEMLGGKILVKSELRKGSTFAMFISRDGITNEPVLADDKFPLQKNILSIYDENKTKIESDSQKDISKITPHEIPDDRLSIKISDKVILIIEDDTAFALALTKSIKERGYKVVNAVSGAEAITYALKYKPFGILLDIQLPVKSGWTIMKELKANPKTSHIPVHMMSSNEIKTKDIIGIGAIDFINKPFTQKELKGVLAKIESISGKTPKKILLVDNNYAHTSAIRNYLENIEKTFVVANTIDEAYILLKKEKIDCIVLDMELPEESGYELLETIKRNKKFEKIPVIIYTGKSISIQAEKKLKQYTSAIIIKTADSFTRLSREISLFLHLVEDKQERKGKLQLPYIKDKALAGKHILMVDDDIRNIYSLTKLLESQKIIVTPASDGNEALKLLKAKKNFDLVLMDMMMPKLDGYQTTLEIRKNPKFKNICVIAVTAKAMLGDREKCLKAGANDYITKPVDGDKLLSLLRVWLYK